MVCVLKLINHQDQVSRIVSVGDSVNMDQAYEISLEANCIVEPVYPN